jgi:hypothetical protein
MCGACNSVRKAAPTGLSNTTGRQGQTSQTTGTPKTSQRCVESNRGMQQAGRSCAPPPHTNNGLPMHADPKLPRAVCSALAKTTATSPLSMHADLSTACSPYMVQDVSAAKPRSPNRALTASVKSQLACGAPTSCNKAAYNFFCQSARRRRRGIQTTSDQQYSRQQQATDPRELLTNTNRRPLAAAHRPLVYMVHTSGSDQSIPAACKQSVTRHPRQAQ